MLFEIPVMPVALTNSSTDREMPERMYASLMTATSAFSAVQSWLEKAREVAAKNACARECGRNRGDGAMLAEAN